MMQYLQLPISNFIIKNINTGNEESFFSYNIALKRLAELREERPGADFILYAEISA